MTRVQSSDYLTELLEDDPEFAPSGANSNYAMQLIGEDQEFNPRPSEADMKLLQMLQQFDPDVLHAEAMKGTGRGILNLAQSPIQARAAVEGAMSFGLSKLTGVDTSQLPLQSTSETQQFAKLVSDNISKITEGKGFLAPIERVQGHTFAWDDPAWWAGQAGEGIIFLASLTIPGSAVARGTQAAGMSARLATTIGASASAATSAVLETGLSFADMRDRLMEEHNLSHEEASQIAGMGASAYGIVAGTLDAIPFSQLLKKMPGGRKQVMQVLLSISAEGGVETGHEGLLIGTESAVGLDPGDISDRLLASGSVGALAAGPVAAVTTSGGATVSESDALATDLKPLLTRLSPEEKQTLLNEVRNDLTDESIDEFERSNLKSIEEEIQAEIDATPQETTDAKEKGDGETQATESTATSAPSTEAESAARRAGDAATESTGDTGTAGGVKQPWEMTREEYLARQASEIRTVHDIAKATKGIVPPKSEMMPNWNPLHIALDTFGKLDAAREADGWMYMGTIQAARFDTPGWNKASGEVYNYKHGISRKGIFVDQEGRIWDDTTQSWLHSSEQGQGKALSEHYRKLAEQGESPQTAYNNEYISRRNKALSDAGYNVLNIGPGQSNVTERASTGGHRDAVERAIAEGKPVPPEVLADYPDLKPIIVGVKVDRGVPTEKRFTTIPPDFSDPEIVNKDIANESETARSVINADASQDDFSRFGAVVGGATGFALGGPTGAVAGAIAGGAAGRPIINLGFRDLIDRVRVTGGEAGVEAAEMGKRSVDREKEVYGQISQELDAVLSAASGRTISSQKASIELQRVDRVEGKNYGFARLPEAVEGRSSVSKNAHKIVDSLNTLIDKTGQVYRDNGHLQYDFNTGEWAPFNYIPGGKVYPRLMHPNMIGIISKGQGPIFNTLVDAIADANQIDAAGVRNILLKMREDYRGDSKDPTAFHRINSEFTRQIPRMPTHLWVNNDVVELIETHPFIYARRLAANAASRTGFISQFGQATERDNIIATLKQRIDDANGNTKAFLDMTRALNGLPVEPPIIEAGSAIGKVVRAYRGVERMAKAGLLSSSVFLQPPELIGNIQAFNGTGDLLRAVWRLSRHPRATVALLQHIGAITHDIANLAYNPNRPFESISRGFSEALSRGTLRKFAEEFQETLAATAALEKAERLQRGKHGSQDIIDLMAMMNIGVEDARRIANGQGTEAEYLAIVRRAPAFLTAGAIRAAELTRMSHSRPYRAAIAFELYAQMKVRSMVSLSDAYGKAFQSRDPRLFTAANLKMARYIAGTSAAGAMQYFLMSFVTGGLSGLEIAWEEMKDEPLEFFAESFVYAMFAGPYGSIIRVMTGGEGNGYEKAIRATMPGFLIDETVSAINGTGSYQNMEWQARAGRWFERLLPVNKAVATTMALFGYGEDSHKMDTAIRAFRRWQFEEKRPGNTEPGDVEEERKRFKTAMRSAYRALRRFDDPSKYIEEAIQVEGIESNLRAAASSLRSRKLLSGLSPEELESVRDRIGDNAFEQVTLHDALLEGWADSFSSSRKKRK